MAIAEADFTFISDFARRSAAIVLETGKEYLVESRLAPIAREVSGGSLDARIASIRGSSPGSALRARTLDALTTNETSFFRDFHPYVALQESILPQLIARRGQDKTLTIWSAACSSGQEPYTLAMIIREHFPALAHWSVRILATDLSPTVLAHARAGVYSQFDVNRGLPAKYLSRNFEKSDAGWTVAPTLRELIDFRPRNLIESWPAREEFDLVLMRNVLIYFDTESRRQVLRNVRARMRPGGVLLLSTAETTVQLDPAWSVVRHDKTSVFTVDDSGARS